MMIMSNPIKNYTMRCDQCGFTTRDQPLMESHSCSVQENGGHCEDWPCCGHEFGDCNGLLYGSNESIKEQVQRQWDTGHGYCDHPNGIYQCDADDPDGDGEEDFDTNQDDPFAINDDGTN